MGLFRDRYAEQKKVEAYQRQVGKMRTPNVAPRGASKQAPAPYTCGRACGYLPGGKGCPSTVRGGVCPCRCC